MRSMLVVLIVTLLIGAPAWAAPTYEQSQLAKPEGVTDLPVIGGINDKGQIAGTYRKEGWDRPFIYKDGDYSELPVLDDRKSDYVVAAINNSGWVVGQACDKDAKTQIPVLWRDGKCERIPLPEGVTSAEAVDINNKGVVLAGREQPFVWDNGTSQLLNIKRCYYVAGINDFGQITGNCEEDAFFYHDGRADMIGGALVGKGIRLGPMGINNKGHVVAIASTDEVDEQRTYLWENGKTKDLGDLRIGSAAYRPKAINDSGIVVGYFETARDRKTGGYVWKEGQMAQLDGPGIPEDINSTGWIVGTKACVWKPVVTAD